jgi:hypothetical protein
MEILFLLKKILHSQITENIHVFPVGDVTIKEKIIN